MKLIYLILLLPIIEILSSQEASVISIKCPNNVSLGHLADKDYDRSNISFILNELFKINSSKIHYTKLENEEQTNLLTNEMHPLVNAVHLAYAFHLNLILTPDIIWNLITSGTSVYINMNSESVRKVFVDHEGQKNLEIVNNELLHNSTNNKWDQVIEQFVEKIQENVKLDAKNLFNANFSTTDQVSSVVSKIVLMEAMQKYFKYKLFTLCGIPEIKLNGTKNDWLLIKQKLNKLNETIPDLSIWYNQLDELINEFINVYENKIDYDFWSKIYKVNGGSGGPYLSGWIMAFYPYLRNNTKNYFVWEKDWKSAILHSHMSGLVTSDFPMSLSKVPFVWNYYGKELNMSFIGGLFGVNYEKENDSLKPVFGYAVAEE